MGGQDPHAVGEQSHADPHGAHGRHRPDDFDPAVCPRGAGKEGTDHTLVIQVRAGPHRQGRIAAGPDPGHEVRWNPP
jgi:hypothetical protein